MIQAHEFRPKALAHRFRMGRAEPEMVAAVEMEELPASRLAVIHAAYIRHARTASSGRACLAPSTSDRFPDYGAKVMPVRASAATPLVKKDQGPAAIVLWN
jgi:hypothetical protein